MDFSPAILLDIALVGVVVFTVAYYMRRGFLAGLLGLVGNLASLALAWFISGRVSPTLFDYNIICLKIFFHRDNRFNHGTQ